MTNYLLFYFQPGNPTWKQIPLPDQSFNIGRAPENNLVLDDAQVSRQHACFHIDGRGVWIMDVGSSNGIIISKQRIPAREWRLIPLGVNFTIGTSTLRVEAITPQATAYQPVVPAQTGTVIPGPAAMQVSPPAGQPKQKKLALPLVGAVLLAACVCLVIGGVAGWKYFPGFFAKQPVTANQPTQVNTEQPAPTATVLVSGPPQVLDSLVASSDGKPVTDDQGVSMTVPPKTLDSGQQASLERAKLSPGMQQEIEISYQVDSLAYAIKLPEGQGAAGRVELALPAKSPDAHLAVLIDDQYLGILETPVQDGALHVTPKASLAPGTQTIDEPITTTSKTPIRYLVLTPKTGSSFVPHGTGRLFSPAAQSDSSGKSCISEFWTATHCWRNNEGSVYVFWKNDVPKDLKDQEYLRIEETINSVAAIMDSYKQRGFTGAAISPSNPAYIVVEADAAEPYYSFKTGNVYVPWDLIGTSGDSKNRCTMAHEMFHWIEDVGYNMTIAALSGPRAWWQDTSAENGSFLLDSSCIEKNLTTYGIVTTKNDVLGFQAAPMEWELKEQARYIHALQLYLSICTSGASCALSQDAWIQAINNGTYPLDGGALTAYKNNAKDLGLFLLGSAPVTSRTDAVIPPSAISGNHYGDYLSLKTSPRGIWDYGLTMKQFTKSDQQVKVEAKIAQGGVYPLWVSNGAGSPMGGGGGNTGLPGVLEIQAGPAFWIKQDDAAPVFYEAGKSLKLGPISDKLGIGKARIVAVAPDGEQTFQANLSLADFSGDYSATLGKLTVTPIDCPGYKEGEQKETADTMLQLFSGYGTYVKDATNPTDLNLTWDGTLPEGINGASEVTVQPDKVKLHYKIEIPKPAESSGTSWLPWLNLDLKRARTPSTWVALLPGLPLLGAAAWLKRQKRRWTWLALAGILLSGALLLSGCFGLGIWGTIDATYTFTKMEYVDPNQAPKGDTAASASQSAVTWKLTNGQVVYNFDLNIEVTTDNADGTSTKEVAPCKLTASAPVTGTIGPDGSVNPPKTSQ